MILTDEFTILYLQGLDTFDWWAKKRIILLVKLWVRVIVLVVVTTWKSNPWFPPCGEFDKQMEIQHQKLQKHAMEIFAYVDAGMIDWVHPCTDKEARNPISVIGIITISTID